ncbi:MAG TPA: MFS transporter [Gaiellaceae bacterium]|jgi:predicted MFS family arabinose efflux permease|nr:MFS transporter [Gaiellaceae bacterium]
MRIVSRIIRLVWGGDVDRALRPVLAVSLAGSIANSAAYTYLGIWAIKELQAGQGLLGTAYLAGAVLGGAIGYLAGHWSDHIGRRPLILVGWGLQATVPLLLLATGHHVDEGLLLIALLPVFGSLGGAADQAMVADLVAPERQEAAYASVRVASNLGVTIGPPIGGLLLIGTHWPHLWLGTFVLATAGFAIAWRYIPSGGAYAPEEAPTRGSLGVILRDRPFQLFLLFAVLAAATYQTTETLLPISVTTTHHLPPSLWGFLMILNPLFVTVFQLRLTRRVAHIPPTVKLALAMPMMGVPFVLLNVNGSAGAVALIVIVFVTGEMLWIPTAQAVVSRLAPADIRGAYMGAYSGAFAIGNAATPFLGLQIRAAFGDKTMWLCVAGLGVLAGALGYAAARGRDSDAAIASPA